MGHTNVRDIALTPHTTDLYDPPTSTTSTIERLPSTTPTNTIDPTHDDNMKSTTEEPIVKPEVQHSPLVLGIGIGAGVVGALLLVGGTVLFKARQARLSLDSASYLIDNALETGPHVITNSEFTPAAREYRSPLTLS